VVLTFNNVNVPYKHSGNRKGKKFSIGRFGCITVSLSTATTENLQWVPFLENIRDPKLSDEDGLEKEDCSVYKLWLSIC
jgi:hypothetical protein